MINNHGRVCSSSPESRDSHEKNLTLSSALGCRRDSLFQRIMKKIKFDESGCLIWTGTKNADGYGQISINGKNMMAHRVSWMIKHREVLTRHDHICHTCDNPSCVNPDHLFKADNAENRRDYHQKIKKHGHLGKMSDISHLTKEDILNIRARMNKRERRSLIADDYGLTVSDIHFIEQRDDWPWIT